MEEGKMYFYMVLWKKMFLLESMLKKMVCILAAAATFDGENERESSIKSLSIHGRSSRQAILKYSVTIALEGIH